MTEIVKGEGGEFETLHVGGTFCNADSSGKERFRRNQMKQKIKEK